MTEMYDPLADAIDGAKDLARLATLAKPDAARMALVRIYWGTTKAASAWRYSQAHQYLLDQFAQNDPLVWRWLEGNQFPAAKRLYVIVARLGRLTKGQRRIALRCIHRRKRAKRGSRF